MVAVATRFGIGVSTDSVAYIAEARQLAGGEGLTLPTGLLEIYADVDPAREVAVTAHFPPLYPTVVAVSGLAHAGASSFRWLNALLLAASSVTVALMVRRYTGSRGVACLAAGMIVLAPAVLRVHSMAWSEPLFLTLGLVGLLALARFVADQRASVLVTGAACLGSAWLTRYVGIAFVLTGLIVLLLCRRRIARRRAASFALLSVLPMTVYLGGMTLADAAGGGFTLLPSRPSTEEIDVGLASLREVVLPARPSSVLLLLLWAPVVLLVYLQLRQGRSARALRPDSGLSSLPLVLGVFLVVYSAILVASITLLAEYLPVEERYLLPLYAGAVPLAACIVSRVPRDRRRLREPLLAVSALVVTSTAVGGMITLGTGTRDYPGFTASAWRRSTAMEEIARLPLSTRIYSNYPEAVYFRTGREARLLPKERLPGNRIPRYRAARMARMKEEVRAGEGVVVLFTSAYRDLLPSPTELDSLLGVPPPVVLADALVYKSGPAR